jgi:hypothetical protein
VTSWAVHRPPRRSLPIVPDVLDNAQGRIRRSPCAAVVVVLRRVGYLDVVSVQVNVPGVGRKLLIGLFTVAHHEKLPRLVAGLEKGGELVGNEVIDVAALVLRALRGGEKRVPIEPQAGGRPPSSRIPRGSCRGTSPSCHLPAMAVWWLRHARRCVATLGMRVCIHASSVWTKLRWLWNPVRTVARGGVQIRLSQRWTGKTDLVADQG